MRHRATAMEAKWMLLPMLGQVALTGFVHVVAYRRRVGAVKAGEMDPLYFKTKQVGEPTRAVKQVDDLVLNLYEVPVIFFAGCLAAIAVDVVDPIALALASFFVAMRMLHARELLGRNSIPRRFRVWTAGLFALAGLWLWIVVSAFT